MGVNEFDEDEGCEHQRTASLVLIGGMGGDAAQRSSSGTIASGPLGASVPVQRSGLPHPKKTAFAVLAESPSVVERLRSVEIAYADVIHGHSMDRLLDKTLPAIYAEVDEAVAEVLDQTPVEGWSENCHPQLASFILLNFISSKVLTPLPCIDDKYSSLAGVLRSKSWWSQRRFAQDERQLFMKPHEWEHVRRWCRNTADETEMGGKTVVPSVTSWVSLCKKRDAQMQLILLLECLRIHSATGIDLPKLPDDFIRKQQQESKAIKAGSRKRSSDGHVVDRPSKRSAVQPESDAIPKPQQAERLYEPGDKEDYVQAGVALMSWVSMLDSLEGGTSAELTKFSEGVVFSYYAEALPDVVKALTGLSSDRARMASSSHSQIYPKHDAAQGKRAAALPPGVGRAGMRVSANRAGPEMLSVEALKDGRGAQKQFVRAASRGSRKIPEYLQKRVVPIGKSGSKRGSSSSSSSKAQSETEKTGKSLSVAAATAAAAAAASEPAAESGKGLAPKRTCQQEDAKNPFSKGGSLPMKVLSPRSFKSKCRPSTVVRLALTDDEREQLRKNQELARRVKGSDPLSTPRKPSRISSTPEAGRRPTMLTALGTDSDLDESEVARTPTRRPRTVRVAVGPDVCTPTKRPPPPLTLELAREARAPAHSPAKGAETPTRPPAAAMAAAPSVAKTPTRPMAAAVALSIAETPTPQRRQRHALLLIPPPSATKSLVANDGVDWEELGSLRPLDSPRTPRAAAGLAKRADGRSASLPAAPSPGAAVANLMLSAAPGESAANSPLRIEADRPVVKLKVKAARKQGVSSTLYFAPL